MRISDRLILLAAIVTSVLFWWLVFAYFVL